MGSHHRNRIKEGSAILDFYPVDGIGIVTAPNLRGVIHHARVKSSTTAAASLYEQIGVAHHDFFQKFIESQHIVISDISCIHIRKAAVHIPFHIVDFALIQHGTNLVVNGIPHFFSGKVQHQLISGTHRFPSRNLNRPVRMGTVQIAVLIYHFRLKPDAKFHAFPMYPVNKLCQCTTQLFLIHGPVSQGRIVIVPPAKPAVIHHHHIDTQGCSLFCQIHNGIAVKIKVSCLPAIDKHRADGMDIFSTAHMVTDAGMVLVGQTGQAFCRIGKHCLRHHKLPAGSKGIVKLLRAKPHKETGLVVLVFLCLAEEISAV